MQSRQHGSLGSAFYLPQCEKYRKIKGGHSLWTIVWKMCVWKAPMVASVLSNVNLKVSYDMKDAPYSITHLVMWLLGRNEIGVARYVQTSRKRRFFLQFLEPPRRLQHFDAKPSLIQDFWLCLWVPHKNFRSWNSRFVDELLRWNEWKNCSTMSILQSPRSHPKKMQKIKRQHGSLGIAFL